MKLAVISHKVCWASADSPSGYVTDGGFPLQMAAISELFSETKVILPCSKDDPNSGVSWLKGERLKIVPLSLPMGNGFQRKVRMIFWVIKNSQTVWREVRAADAVHAPIPGDVGTVGMIFSMLQRKPLFVRHCGNWFVQRTVAERFWKWSMEYFAGGRNVMLATGGAAEPPSKSNANVQWIFSTSLRRDQIAEAEPRELSTDDIRLIIACRQEEGKGTATVIDSLPLILKSLPHASLDVVGGGALLEKLKRQVETLSLSDRVRFHGKVEQREVLDLLKKAHVFCYPTSASEGFPKVVLEALACGLPVITTRVSVLPQLIDSGGVLLNEPTPVALAGAVKEICSDKGKYDRMSRAAIETAQQYSLEQWRDNIGVTLREAWKVASLSLI